MQRAVTSALWRSIVVVTLCFFSGASALEASDAVRSFDVEYYSVQRFVTEADKFGVVEFECGDETIFLELEATTVREGARARTYRGTVVDEPNSDVRLSATRGGLCGTIRRGDSWTFIEPAPNLARRGRRTAGRPHRVFTKGDVDVASLGLCNHTTAHAHASDSTSDADPVAAAAVEAGEAGELRLVEIAIEADHEFFLEHGNGAAETIEATINAVNGIFEEQLGITLEITDIFVWESSNDPYSTSNSARLLGQFRSNFEATRDATPRDLAHLFTGRNLNGAVIGIAYLGGACSTTGYGLSQDLGSPALLPILVAHELAHGLGATHDPHGAGTIMAPGLSPDASEFSASSYAQIAEFIDNHDCIQHGTADVPAPPAPPAPESFVRGDVDGDHTVGILDVLRFIEIIQRRNTWDCLDPLDIDDSGTVTIRDLLLLYHAILTPGSAPPAAPYPDRGLDPTADSFSDCSRG